MMQFRRVKGYRRTIYRNIVYEEVKRNVWTGKPALAKTSIYRGLLKRIGECIKSGGYVRMETFANSLQPRFRKSPLWRDVPIHDRMNLCLYWPEHEKD
jgi:hypothetical protein